MIVGIDFDNTIVCYDQLLHRVASDQGLIPAELPASKERIRDFLRQNGKEEQWIELQGYIYGVGIQDATAFPGVVELLGRCVRHHVPVYIVSHKTRRPFRGPECDLHEAAHKWLEGHGFYNSAETGLSPERVHFELTKQAKLDRIGKVGCTHFIDDLPEFFAEPGFPSGVERILFDPTNNVRHRGLPFQQASSWAEIALSLPW
jgi:hypothetical protein